MNTNLTSLLAALLLTGLMVACSSNSSDNTETSETAQHTQAAEALLRKVEPPMPDLTVPYQRFEVSQSADQSEPTVLEMENGTVITIPASAFVDNKQMPVQGEVEVTYREFHDVADIIMSGIPMHYDSAGKTHVLQTAGMMEIRANQNGTPVYLANGKSIDVEMASYQSGGNYNQYYWDEGAGNWTYQQTSQTTENPKSQRLDQQIAQIEAELVKPYKPKRLGANATPFAFEVDYSRYPQLAPFENLTWQMRSPSKDQWVFGQVWKKAKVTQLDAERDFYAIELSNGSNTAVVQVTPVVEDEDFEEAMATYDRMVKEYEAKLEELKRQKQRMAALLRRVQAGELGIYNFDRILKFPTQEVITATFEFPDNPDMGEIVETVFMVLAEDQAVIPFHKNGGYYDSWNKMYYSPDAKKTLLVAIMPDGKAAVFTDQAFRTQQPKGKFTFQMQGTEKTISNASDLRSLLNS